MGYLSLKHTLAHCSKTNELPRRKQRGIKNKNIERPKGRGIKPLSASGGIKRYEILNWEYVRKKINPARKGFVLKSEDWKYSRARNWNLGGHDVISLDLDQL